MKKNKNKRINNEILEDILYEYINIISPYTKMIVYYENKTEQTERYNKINKILNNNLKIMIENKEERKKLSEETNYKYKNVIKELVNDYPYVLKNYIMTNKIINIKISNAFTKLYEILYIFNKYLFKNDTTKKEINVYHMAEAPGQWIKCMDLFIKKNKINKEYKWYANTLNPNNEENKNKYNIIFDDKYGLIRENIDKWLYGEDDTGDIMRIENIINIKNELNKKNFKPDLITSDAGIDTKENDIKMLHKLDYAQLINIIILAKKNTNIIIKTFLPYIINKKESLTEKSVNFFISIIYLYVKLFEQITFYKPMTSGVTTGEFYIIGIKYNNNITEELKNILINKLRDFNIETYIINPEIISNYIKYQIYGYLNDIIEINNRYIKIENEFLKIIKKKIMTNEFLEILEKIKIKKIKYWLIYYEFI